MGKPVLCLSGGLDSVTCLAIQGASKCLFFDYGQIAAAKEHEAAQFYARFFHVPLQVLELPWLATLAQNSGLLRGSVPKFEEPSALDRPSTTRESARAVWVPARNLVFLSAAAAVAEAEEFDSVALGLNREEGATFPDNSREFLEAANETLAHGTLRKVRVVAPVIGFDKNEMVQLLRQRDVPLDACWRTIAARRRRTPGRHWKWNDFSAPHAPRPWTTSSLR